jgi:outer membrane immunogenic protein
MNTRNTFFGWLVPAGLGLGLAWASMGPAFGQGAPAADGGPVLRRMEIGANYNYVRQCGCLSLNGGNGWVSFSLTPSISAVAEVGVDTASNIDGSGENLTLVTYLAGPRYRWKGRGPFTPFIQGLLGETHASGSAVQAEFAGSSNAFATLAGGGLDIRVSRRFTVRAIEADHFLTHFANGVNEPRNYLRVGAGVVFTLR